MTNLTDLFVFFKCPYSYQNQIITLLSIINYQLSITYLNNKKNYDLSPRTVCHKR